MNLFLIIFSIYLFNKSTEIKLITIIFYRASRALSEAGWISKIDLVINTLGSRMWHLPALLAWSVLQGRHSQTTETSKKLSTCQYGKLAERAIRGNVFYYLQTVLDNPVIEVINFEITKFRFY